MLFFQRQPRPAIPERSEGGSVARPDSMCARDPRSACGLSLGMPAPWAIAAPPAPCAAARPKHERVGLTAVEQLLGLGYWLKGRAARAYPDRRSAALAWLAAAVEVSAKRGGLGLLVSLLEGCCMEGVELSQLWQAEQLLGLRPRQYSTHDQRSWYEIGRRP
jgi:hypothetical protein